MKSGTYGPASERNTSCAGNREGQEGDERLSFLTCMEHWGAFACCSEGSTKGITEGFVLLSGWPGWNLEPQGRDFLLSEGWDWGNKGRSWHPHITLHK